MVWGAGAAAGGGAGAGSGTGAGAAGGCTAGVVGAGATNGTGAGGGTGSAAVLSAGSSGVTVVVGVGVVVLLGDATVVVARTVVAGRVVTLAGDDDAGPQPAINAAPRVAAAITGMLRGSDRKMWPFMVGDPALNRCGCTSFSNCLARYVPRTRAFVAYRAR